MSEFKYACPVCGQHIKCDSLQAGTVMDCPTCFQKITVPQAPSGEEDQKFILTGSKVGEKRPDTWSNVAVNRQPAKAFPVAAVAFVVALVLAAGAGVYFLRGQIGFSHGHWQTADVGAVGPAGSYSRDGERYQIAGSGADIWFQADGFRYVYQPMNGDVGLTARVLLVPKTDPWAKAGLMVRETLAPDSAHAALFVTPSSGVEFQIRATAGGQATAVRIVPQLQAPYWLRLTRKGDTFTAESSADGTDWTPQGSTIVAMQKTVYAGLAVTSHNHPALCRAVFDQVRITGAGARNPPPNSAANPVPRAGPLSGISSSAAAPGLALSPASDTNWMLELTNAIPGSPVAGRIHGLDFLMERASFQGGSLAFRAGAHGPMEFGLVINFSGAQAESLSGKSINVTTNAEKAARVTLRWKDANGTVQKPGFDTGYALRLEFGELANNRLPGKIYLCLPDAEKSYVLGSFTAAVSKPKPKPDAPPKS